MNQYFTIGHRLPRPLARLLFGDREKYGYTPVKDDPSWVAMQAIYTEFYRDTQKGGVGNLVNEAGYRILSSYDFSGKTVLEFGPGEIPHMKFWKNKPECFYFADFRKDMLEQTAVRLNAAGVKNVPILLERDNYGKLPRIEGEHFDAILSFYSLEHLYPLGTYLENMLKTLKPGGFLIGAIPTEGGLGWGVGRYLTSRRYLEKRNISMQKVISWEHPNFAEVVLKILDEKMERKKLSFWPLIVPSIDLNLIVRFVYFKK